MNSRLKYRNTRRGAAFCLFSGLAAAMCNFDVTKAGVHDGYIGAQSASANASSTQALAHAGGEFRIVAANVLWLSVLDHYHHQYLAQGGDWSKDDDILPIIHLIVTLDPHFIEAYGVSFMILAESHRLGEASTVLSQGMQANPANWQIAYDRAMLEAWYRKDPKSALPYAETARRLATDPFDQRRLNLFCKTLRSEVKAS